MGSEILIVLAGVIAIVVLTAAYFMVMPIFLNLHGNPNDACQNSPQCMTIFATQYDVMFVLFQMFLGGTILALYIRAARRDSTVQYSEDF